MAYVLMVGVIYGVQLAFEFMGKDKGGSGGFVINIASIAGLESYDLAPVYSGTKHGVIGLTKSYGQPYHFENTGVAVSAVCPGSIDTHLFRIFPSLVLNEEMANEHQLNKYPVCPSEVGKAVVKLLRDGENGALLLVDCDGIRYAD